MKQNKTELILWKNAPYSRGTARCFLCMIFQGSIRYRSGQRFSKVISSIRGGKKGQKYWNTTKQKQNYRVSALCWEVVTPWGLALRKGSQSTGDPPWSKAVRGWMVIWGFMQSQIFINGSAETLQIRKASLQSRLSIPQPERQLWI